MTLEPASIAPCPHCGGRYLSMDAHIAKEHTAEPLPARIAMEVLTELEDKGPPAWLVHSLAYSTGLTMISGAPKQGKSTLAAQLVESCVKGEPFLGYSTTRSPVLLLTEEGEFSFSLRWKRAVVAARDGDTAFDVVIFGEAVVAAGRLREWADLLAGVTLWCKGQYRPIVVIDTLAMWAGIEDENSSADTTRAIAMAKGCAHESGAAIILIHHSRKGGGSHGEAIRGSTAILATVDVSIELRTISEASSDRKLYVQTRVGASGWEVPIAFDPVDLTYSLGESGPDMGEREDWIKRVPADGDGFSIADLVGVWGVSSTTVHRRVETLLNIGRMREGVVQRGRAKAAVYWGKPPAVGTRIRPLPESGD